MTKTLPAIYCNGENLHAVPVVLALDDGEAFHVTGAGIDRTVRYATVTVTDRLARLPRFLRLDDASVIEVPYDDTLEAALDAARGGRPLSRLVHWLESRAAVAAVATLVLAATVAAALWRGLPMLARRAAEAVPPAIEIEAGRAGYNVFAQAFAPSQLTPEEQARVNRQLVRLTTAMPTHVRPSVRFLSMESPNAFALPGGIVVVTDELVLLLTNDEELLAVLAHELGHVERRHGLQSVLRNSSALIIVCTITGDLSTLTTFSGTLPFLLLHYGYAREFEWEADQFAAHALRAAHLSPGLLAAALEKLDQDRPKSGPDFSYLSTHPSSADRIKALRTPVPAAPASSP